MFYWLGVEVLVYVFVLFISLCVLFLDFVLLLGDDLMKVFVLVVVFGLVFIYVGVIVVDGFWIIFIIEGVGRIYLLL